VEEGVRYVTIAGACISLVRACCYYPSGRLVHARDRAVTVNSHHGSVQITTPFIHPNYSHTS
jgi:hypothetical protein